MKIKLSKAEVRLLASLSATDIAKIQRDVAAEVVKRLTEGGLVEAVRKLSATFAVGDDIQKSTATSTFAQVSATADEALARIEVLTTQLDARRVPAARWH